MKPTQWEADSRLFVFGSLMDSDVLELVSGMRSTGLTIVQASASGYRQCEVTEESYPVLVVDDTAECHGLLIGGLTALAVERILFFEGEEYTLEPITVSPYDPYDSGKVSRKVAPTAWYFSDTGSYTVRAQSWSFDDWQKHHKQSFVEATAGYMQLFGKMTAADADAHWVALTSGDTPTTIATGN